MKRMTRLIAVLFSISLFTGIAVAAQHNYDDSANPRKGKYLWKKKCQSCHIDGQEGGVLSPSTKTQKQWDHFFEKDQNQTIQEKCKKYSESDLHDIRHYLYDHAVDSDQPETCG